MTNNNTTTEEFAIGAGEIYIASGNVAGDELESPRYKAGDVENGCILRYEYKLRELYDVEGNPVKLLRFGETIRFRGKLCRVTQSALRSITDGGKLSVLISCPAAEGENLRFLMHGVTVSACAVNMGHSGSLDFEMCGGAGERRPRFTITGGAV